MVVKKYTLSGDVTIESVESLDSFPAAYGAGLVADDSGATLAGYALANLEGQDGVGHHDVFVRRYDAAGNQSWTLQYGSPSADHGNARFVHLVDTAAQDL